MLVGEDSFRGLELSLAAGTHDAESVCTVRIYASEV